MMIANIKTPFQNLHFTVLANRPLHGFRRRLGCVAVAAKLQQIKCMGYCSTFNAASSAIVQRMLTKKMFFTEKVLTLRIYSQNRKNRLRLECP